MNISMGLLLGSWFGFGLGMVCSGLIRTSSSAAERSETADNGKTLAV